MYKTATSQSALNGLMVNNEDGLLAASNVISSFQTIFNKSPLGNLILSRELVILQANVALCNLLGFELADEIVGTNILKYTQQKHRPDWLMLQQSMWMMQLPSYSLDTCLLNKYGTCVDCNITSILYQDNGSNLSYITIEDISVRKRNDELKKKSEANLLTILNHTDSGYVLYNKSLNIVTFNAVSERLAQILYDKPLVIGSYMLDYFPKDRHPAILHIIKRVMYGEDIVYERYFNTSEGERWLEVKWINVSSDNENWGFILTSKDITESKIAALELENTALQLTQRNKALEQFTNITSHNLRAPLANIIGLAEIMENLPLDEDERKKMVGDILLSARKLDMVINDINDILHAKDRVTKMRESINLLQLVSDIKVSISKMIAEQNAVIKCNFGNVPEMMSIPSYLYSIFYNMILNSLKYHREGIDPQITLSSNVCNNKIELSFKDNGKGMDLEKNGNNLFGLYKRFDNTVEGRGLGLYMVKTQIETLGGTVDVKSVLGRGTEFIVSFPMEKKV